MPTRRLSRSITTIWLLWLPIARDRACCMIADVLVRTALKWAVPNDLLLVNETVAATSAMIVRTAMSSRSVKPASARLDSAGSVPDVLVFIRPTLLVIPAVGVDVEAVLLAGILVAIGSTPRVGGDRCLADIGTVPASSPMRGNDERLQAFRGRRVPSHIEVIKL